MTAVSYLSDIKGSLKVFQREKVFGKGLCIYVSVCTLYPTAATQAVAASTLFIAARLRTGPACLSQDLGVGAAIVGDGSKCEV